MGRGLTADDVLGADDAKALHEEQRHSTTSGSTRARPSRMSLNEQTGKPSGNPRAPDGPEADLYLEGHDQHRGWFHSSLLIALRGPKATRRTGGLLTHGFTVERVGPARMSKEPGQLHLAAGSDAKKRGRRGSCRLWCAATDYSGRPRDRREDPSTRVGRLVPAHPQHTALSARQHEQLRRDAKTGVPIEQMPRDRPLGARARAAQFQGRGGSAHYQVLRVPPGRRGKLQVFCSEDLGRVPTSTC